MEEGDMRVEILGRGKVVWWRIKAWAKRCWPLVLKQLMLVGADVGVGVDVGVGEGEGQFRCQFRPNVISDDLIHHLNPSPWNPPSLFSATPQFQGRMACHVYATICATDACTATPATIVHECIT